MIKRGISDEFDIEFDSVMYLSDWRFSAAAVGIVRYFRKTGKIEGRDYQIGYGKRKDLLFYNFCDIDISKNKDKYYSFVEDYYSEKMHHIKLKNLLLELNLNEDQIKEINGLLSINSIMKKVFGKIKYSQETKDEILGILNENRIDIIRETYRNGMSTYRKFCNQNSLESPEQDICRLVGYYVDLPKKKKSISFNWNYSTFVHSDCMEFDYIPFAFSISDEAIFVNNNFSIEDLVDSNIALNDFLNDSVENVVSNNYKNVNYTRKINPRIALFLTSSKSAQFIDYQVEIITKNRDEEFFRTMFVRDSAINVFKKIADDENILKALTTNYKYGKSEFKNATNDVVDSIINNIYLDNLIENLLKDIKDNKHGFLISQLIRINNYIYQGENDMAEIDKRIMFAKRDAEKVVRAIQKNKVESYRTKLISCLAFKDYDRFCTILLQLASYSKVSLTFAYKLFDDFDANKNLAYAFVNGLVFKENE